MKKMILVSIATMLTTAPAFAQEAMAQASYGTDGWKALASALAIALAAVGGALAQGKIGAAAMEGIARNPQAQKNMFVPMILGLVLIESLVIYALVIAFMIKPA